MIDLREMAEAIDSALAEGNVCLVATASAAGMPDVAFKGSVMVFDTDHLAFWERSGGQTNNGVQIWPCAVAIHLE